MVVGTGFNFIPFSVFYINTICHSWSYNITDRKKELNLDPGDTISVAWEDFGHMLNLSGRVVRIEELENGIVYGLEICNVCKDLPSYISKKQRQKR